jgi:hypothetical protein
MYKATAPLQPPTAHAAFKAFSRFSEQGQGMSSCVTKSAFTVLRGAGCEASHEFLHEILKDNQSTCLLFL